MTTATHRIATSKAIRSFVPLLLMAYFMAFVDRSNVGLAKTALEADVGISATAYGLGAGIFFLSYALLEIPSNLVLHRVGPRIWITRIAITWGLLSSALMFVNSETTFYILRFLLGAAEAGLYPALMYVVTVWFAQEDRARVVGYILIASSLAYALGGPIGGALMTLDGTLGLHGWQWLFLIEGIPSVIIGLLIWFKLPDSPHEAKFLTAEEADALVRKAAVPAKEQIRGNLGAGFRNPVILLVATIYFLNQVVTYGSIFFVPSVVESMGVEGSFTIGVLAGAIGVGSILGVLVFPRWLRRTGNELPLIALASASTVAFSATFLLVQISALQYLMLMLSAFMFTGVLPMFWSIAMARVSGKMAAAVLAFINTIGLTGGFVGPYLFGIAEDLSGDPAAGLVVVLISSVISLALTPILVRAVRRSSALTAEIPEPRASSPASDVPATQVDVEER
ncbi:MFS transporter [Nocardioides insulae]|uniref:MFS transporter n=1 Tax=Nocardioides insulae TaxID=394734 RepID=UPI00041E9103|nr:MFS transporter [Nocardioides insulae]